MHDRPNASRASGPIDAAPRPNTSLWILLAFDIAAFGAAAWLSCSMPDAVEQAAGSFNAELVAPCYSSIITTGA